VVLTSSHKCFALPPGLAFAAVSEQALERAAQVEHRGWYFDFLSLDRYLQKNATPSTPPISLLYALDLQLDRMLSEGLDARFARHAGMASMVQEWAGEHFGLFAAKGYRSKTVTAIQNTRGVDLQYLNAHLSAREMQISNGYGPLKDRTFRIAHMGETRPEDLEELFVEIRAYIS
jgi:aspartate aminotransferase-like enzyme